MKLLEKKPEIKKDTGLKEPVHKEPVNKEPAKIEPVKSDAVKTAPVKTEPMQKEPVPNVPKSDAPPAKPEVPVPKPAKIKEKGGKLMQWAQKVKGFSSQKNDKEY